MNIRPVEDRDVNVILAIQSACPDIAQWVAGDYARAIAGEMAGWVAEEGSEVTGFLVARRLVGDIEILNFAVRPVARRRGVGASLLREALGWGGSFQARRAHLEVRASNLPALRFYERHGFVVAGRRPRYYSAPVEDALLLTVTLP
ncbi:MAG TPA: GNAT family N-acetyltransferase [Candidatus Polarisedimenticolia bacterium]|nr:GNAT family N-acetyltransferase [Candidatus Polarisedimenticolia bacterium]